MEHAEVGGTSRYQGPIPRVVSFTGSVPVGHIVIREAGITEG